VLFIAGDSVRDTTAKARWSNVVSVRRSERDAIDTVCESGWLVFLALLVPAYHDLRSIESSLQWRI